MRLKNENTFQFDKSYIPLKAHVYNSWFALLVFKYHLEDLG